MTKTVMGTRPCKRPDWQMLITGTVGLPLHGTTKYGRHERQSMWPPRRERRNVRVTGRSKRPPMACGMRYREWGGEVQGPPDCCNHFRDAFLRGTIASRTTRHKVPHQTGILNPGRGKPRLWSAPAILRRISGWGEESADSEITQQIRIIVPDRLQCLLKSLIPHPFESCIGSYVTSPRPRGGVK